MLKAQDIVLYTVIDMPEGIRWCPVQLAIELMPMVSLMSIDTCHGAHPVNVNANA